MIKTYMYAKRKDWFILILCLFIFGLIFYLHELPLAAIKYAFLLAICFALVGYGYDFYQYVKQYQFLLQIKRNIRNILDEFPEPHDGIEAVYQDILMLLHEQRLQLNSEHERMIREAKDYYTAWAHQIKTPISAMRLLLQTQRSEDNRLIQMELFKIEQYVEMVLQYARLHRAVHDFRFQGYSVSEMVKRALRKYSVLFIQKKITLDFAQMDIQMITDEKWFVFILEQILSNALKYTPEGGIICIEMLGVDTLCIKDSGVGISAEDLPRVFEKGFTGFNGRMNQKSTGIGLYLCKKIADDLGVIVEIQSEIGKGTSVLLRWDVNGWRKDSLQKNKV